MIFQQQTAWPWMIAVYLFLGGIGGGVIAIGTLADLFLQPNDADADRRPAVFAGILGWLALAIGSLVLLHDLEQPLKSYLAIRNLRSWIAWGVMFITLFMGTVPLYVWPYLQGRRIAYGWQRIMGALSGALGVLVAVYTGFLLSSSTGTPFWHPAVLPGLFVLSGLSTGAAALMLYVLRLGREGYPGRLLHKLERWDMALVISEVCVLAVLLVLGYQGKAAAQESVRILLSSAWFLVGVPVAGLLLPLLLEWRGLRRPSNLVTASAGVLVIGGGILLRFFILDAGVWGIPLP